MRELRINLSTGRGGGAIFAVWGQSQGHRGWGKIRRMSLGHLATWGLVVAVVGLGHGCSCPPPQLVPPMVAATLGYWDRDIGKGLEPSGHTKSAPTPQMIGRSIKEIVFRRPNPRLSLLPSPLPHIEQVKV